MNTLFRWTLVLSLVFAIPSGAFAAASTISEILGVTDNGTVTRSQFLKASVIVLGLSVDSEDLRAYVRRAEERNAFDVFGPKPNLSGAITRGEAIRLIAELGAWKGTGAVLPFRDVEAGTDLEAAVHLAVQHAWTRPFRERTFGVNAALRGKEARTLLTRAATDAGTPQSMPIKVTPKKRSPIQFGSAKFREQVRLLLADEYLYGDKLKSATGSTAKEIVDSLHDPYTTLFDPSEAQSFRDQLKGTITGIGVHLDDERYEVLSVVEGSPAERAGILAGDRIVSVNKKRVEAMKFEEVITRIRGRKGSPVRIGVNRSGEDLTFDIIRAAIDIPDTKVEIRNNVAIVKISQFGDHLIRDAEKLFDDLAAADPDGIIIDLRSNPGGYLNAVPAVLGEFLPDGSVYLYTSSRTFRDSYVTDGAPSIAAETPLVVLTNAGSASSAEIVAGALQDYGRATIVGTKTYGKGTVQTVYPFANKSSLKFTIAEWLTPLEHPINEVGITPDVVVEQGDAGDAQLEKALEIIHALSR